MSYTTLYRKYRPADFEDVKGQDHIVTTLKNQIRAGRIGHAYLFCGTRGTGKTTVAKILAKAVNCEHPADGSPCGECAVCRSIAAGTSMNVIEIDAASNNGVDDVRQIREEVEYAPTEGKYKVYIIDEVHMLSAAAFNALLKTLEEPPSYVIFILATTEPHRIPVTILSRCQRYDFRWISLDTIAARLGELMDAEGVDAEEKALRYVAKAADGSMRDALSLLDQCLAFFMDRKLTYENVLEVIGSVDLDIFSRLLRALIGGNVTAAISLLEEVVVQGRDLGQFVSDFTWYLRNLLLIRSDEAAGEIIDMSGENLALLKEEAQMISPDVLMRYIRLLSELSGQIRYAPQKRVLIEVALIKMCRPQMEQSQDALIDRVAKLEAQMEQGVPVQRAAEALPPVKRAEKKPAEKKLPDAMPEDIEKLIRNWNGIVESLEHPLKGYLKCTSDIGLDLKAGDTENTLILIFPAKLKTPHYQRISRENTIRDLEDLFSEKIGKRIRLEVCLEDEDSSRERHTSISEISEKLSLFEDKGVEVIDEKESEGGNF